MCLLLGSEGGHKVMLSPCLQHSPRERGALGCESSLIEKGSQELIPNSSLNL